MINGYNNRWCRRFISLFILFVTNLPVYWLNWLVVAVVVYTSVTMFKSALSENDEKELELQAS